MKIHLPRGYQPPQGTNFGEPFEAVAVLIPSEDGVFVLKSIDGVDLGEEEEEMKSPIELPWEDGTEPLANV